MRGYLFLVLTFYPVSAQTIPPNVQINTFGTFHPEVPLPSTRPIRKTFLVSSNGLQVYYSYDGEEQITVQKSTPSAVVVARLSESRCRASGIDRLLNLLSLRNSDLSGPSVRLLSLSK